MGEAKKILIKPISKSDADAIVKKYHYSGKVVNNSNINFGVFYLNKLLGAMQFGPPMVKNKLLGLVEGTKWDGILELNRMAFSDLLPKNSESRALAISLNILKKKYPTLDWVVTFADGTQCGDGTIYRAAGFLLTSIKKNNSIIKLVDGTITTNMTVGKGIHALRNNGKSGAPLGAKKLAGYQLRYIYFLNKEAQTRLTCQVLPYDKIKEIGASMYRGKCLSRIESSTSDFQSEGVGASPTDGLHLEGKG